MKEKEKNVVYAYIVGKSYKHYMAYYEGSEEVKAFNKEFESYDALIEFVVNFSNYYSLPIQFYY